MRINAIYQVENINQFKKQLIAWASNFEQSAVLLGDADDSQGKYMQYDMLVGVEALSEISPETNSFDALESYQTETKDWLFGYFSYDLKNELEELCSDNSDKLHFPLLHFFQPKWVFKIKDNKVEIQFHESIERKKMQQIFGDIMQFKIPHDKNKNYSVKSKIAKEDYLQSVKKLQEHIQRGDIYEVNFCQEYFCEEAVLNPITVFTDLYSISESPFACYYRYQHCHIMSASPERFIKKMGKKLISQPIKGTRKRGASLEEDEQLKLSLYNCPKERSENVMIVDLVRNDLSRSASKSTVQVEELFGIYSFPQVHQMISTVVSELKDGFSGVEAIRYAFPMGSMTGAPKIRAMELIEKFESTKRGVYSGSVGYFTPEGDFDFNVVIRSVLYNSTSRYASFMVGSAITTKAIPEQEYEECLIKAKAMFKVLGHAS